MRFTRLTVAKKNKEGCQILQLQLLSLNGGTDLGFAQSISWDQYSRHFALTGIFTKFDISNSNHGNIIDALLKKFNWSYQHI